MASPRIALALGAGGARAYANIGVIDELTKRGFTVCAVAGASMGALVGGLLAAGRLEPYVEWVTSLAQRDVLRLLDPVLPYGPGMIRAERVLSKMDEILEGVLIEDLPIPYTAIAADVLARREVWFQEGPLLTAIRASIALPTVITPIVVNGRLLMDGGILNPVPVDPLTPVARDLTIAVSMSGPRGSATPVLESSAPKAREEWLDRVRHGLFDNDLLRPLVERLGGDKAEATPSEPDFEHPTGLNMVDVSALALETMGALVERYRTAGQPPDLMIRVPRDVCGVLDFHRAAEVIDVGRECAAIALDAFAAEHPEWAEKPPTPEEAEAEPTAEEAAATIA